VHQVWWNGIWHTFDVTAATGARNAAAGSALVRQIDTILNHLEVYYIGSNQHVYQLWWNGTWHFADVSALAGAPNAAAGTALAVMTIDRDVEIYYLGSNQHVYQLQWNGTWHSADVTAFAGAPNAAAGTPLASQVDTVTNTIEVYYLGSNQHVYQLWWNGVWHTADLTVFTGAPNAAAGSPLVSQIDTILNHPEVYYLGSNQHVYQLWWNGTWHFADVTALAGAPNAAAGTALASQVDTVTNTIEVYYLGPNQNVYQLWWNGVWHTADLTVFTGAPNAAAGSPLVSQIDTILDHPEVYYIGSNQHVYQLWWNGTWHTADITILASAPPAVP
jgi:hypothetical protein